MRYRYQDPSKIPAWKRYGRLGLVLLSFNVTGYIIITKVFGKSDGSSSLADINEKIKEAHLHSVQAIFGEATNAKQRQIKIKGLTVVENKEVIISKKDD